MSRGGFVRVSVKGLINPVDNPKDREVLSRGWGA
jgi:hypothetical protein